MTHAPYASQSKSSLTAKHYDLVPGAFVPWALVSPRESPNSLASLLGIQLTPSPGTVLAKRSTYLYFGAELQTIVQTDRLTFFLISSLLAGESTSEVVERLAQEGMACGSNEIIERLTALRDVGLFAAPDSEKARADASHSIDVLLRHQPMKLMLFVAQSCNLRCTYCYGIEGNYHDSGAQMSLEVARKSVDYLLDSCGVHERTS